MLVEKKISSKLNYDVLRDLDAGFSEEQSSSEASAVPVVDSTQPFGGLGFDEPSSSGLTGATSVADRTDQFSFFSPSSLEVTRPPSSGVGRLPSLHTRKRTLSSLGGGSTYGTIPKQVILEQQLHTCGQAHYDGACN